MKSIVLFMVYYGKLPNYFDLWLKAIEFNRSINVCIISDCINSSKSLPSNVRLRYMSFDTFKSQVQSKFDFKISLKNYGRISQFRPALAYIFPEEVEGYDYWGFIECDLIPGNIRKFITEEILAEYDKIFKLGHFQIFKNNAKMNTLFMQKTSNSLDYRFAFKENVLFFEELLGMHNIAEAIGCKTYENNIFADILCYEFMFNTSTYGYNDSKYAGKCIFEFDNGSLYKYYIQNENNQLGRQEILYVHLQKRAMNVSTTDYNNYIIIPNSFAIYSKINTEYFLKIENNAKNEEEEYCKEIKSKLHIVQNKRNRELCWWKLRAIRYRIRKHGGIDLDGQKH